ncbi:MAG TPA: ATP-binding protein [Terracidiphilus sp.]|nr:ATP-binding protein [Terracidiphilus sp.]
MSAARRSIAFRLITAVLAVELLSSLLVGFLSLGYERHIHFEAFEVMLRGRADTVLGAVEDAEDPSDNVILNRADLHLPKDDVYEAYDDRGRLLGRSQNWQGTDGPPAEKHKMLHLVINGRHYALVVRHGVRTTDPNEHGGGKIHRITVLYGGSTERVWHAINGAVEFYALGSVLLLLVTGPLIAWLLHRGLLPLRQLAALAAHVSVDSWQFSPPASARATPELAPLTHAVESVLQRLERSFTQQRVFVSDAAHELKTAVAVVKSSLQLLGLRPRSPSEYQAGIERTLADTQRLEELVAKMLTLARVENSAAGGAAPVETDLAECLKRAVEELGTVAELRRVKTKVDAPAGECRVGLTEEDCSLLLSNLLLNALQHSPLESNVNLRLAVKPEEKPVAELIVEDHGDGIDASALPHIFDRFYRGDPSRTRSTGGAGLGLAICKAIVERAGGTIAITSRLGEGATVTVIFPLMAPTVIEEQSP